MTYRIFSRRSWSGNKRAGFKPAASPPGNTIAHAQTIEEARRLCSQGPGNKARDTGKEYRHLTMHEFEEVTP